MAESNQLVQKLWNFCNVLRDDGVSTIEYVEQLTYLLFLKMADERQKAGLGEVVPHGLDWQSLLDRDGDELEVHYRHILENLGKLPGTLGTIYRKAQNRIQDPAKLRRLVVNLINEELWTAVDADLKGDAYEGLLQKGAEDTKSGAGQYFTPRPLTRAMIACLRPGPGQVRSLRTRPVAPAASSSPPMSGSSNTTSPRWMPTTSASYVTRPCTAGRSSTARHGCAP